jgi:hypothetical protein
MEAIAGLMSLEQAVAKLEAKAPVASKLRTAEWSRVPLALRERAQFSAGVENARFLQTVQDQLRKAISLRKEQAPGGEAFVDRSSFIGELRKMAFGEGISDLTGGLTDLASRARLGLIFDMQTEQAAEYSRWKWDQDPDILDAFPAQELIRVESRRVPRDWRTRWQEAGGRLVDGRMVALKSDPIWMGISAFGTPWPPFDFASGMGLQDVSRADAEALGLIKTEQAQTPQQADFNQRLEASAKDLSPALVQALQRAFGNQIRVDGDTIEWAGAA